MSAISTLASNRYNSSLHTLKKLTSKVNMSNNQSGMKRKNKWKYNNGKKSKFDDSKNHDLLYENLVGFLVTCNGNEYRCLQETYNILEEISEKLYGKFGEDIDDDNSSEENGDDADIEASIKKEVDRLKTAKTRRFIQVKTKCKNILFIKSNDPKVSPNEITQELFRQIEAERRQTVCNISRLVPVIGTFKADPDKLESRLEPMFDELATKKAVSFGALAKARNNSEFPSDTALMKRAIAVLRDKRPNWYVNLNDPQIFVLVNIVQRSLCLSLLENYNKYAKYNPIEFYKKVSMASSKEIKLEKFESKTENEVKIEKEDQMKIVEEVKAVEESVE